MWKTGFKKFEVIWSAETDHFTSIFLKAAFHKFYLVYSSILCPKYFIVQTWVCQNKTLKSSETSKPLWRLHSGRWTVTHPPSENKGLRNIGHNMRVVLDTKRSIFGSQHWLWFNIWFIMILYYKMRQIFKNLTAILLQNATEVFLQNASGFLFQNVTVSLQNATHITKCVDFTVKCDTYYKMCWIYYKMRQLLQNVSV